MKIDIEINGSGLTDDQAQYIKKEIEYGVKQNKENIKIPVKNLKVGLFFDPILKSLSGLVLNEDDDEVMSIKGEFSQSGRKYTYTPI